MNQHIAFTTQRRLAERLVRKLNRRARKRFLFNRETFYFKYILTVGGFEVVLAGQSMRLDESVIQAWREFSHGRAA